METGLERLLSEVLPDGSFWRQAQTVPQALRSRRSARSASIRRLNAMPSQLDEDIAVGADSNLAATGEAIRAVDQGPLGGQVVSGMEQHGVQGRGIRGVG